MNDFTLVTLVLFIGYITLINLLGWFVYYIFGLKRKVSRRNAFTSINIIAAAIAFIVVLIFFTIGIR